MQIFSPRVNFYRIRNFIKQPISACAYSKVMTGCTASTQTQNWVN